MSIPAFSSPVDCTPWVTGGLWPAELSAITPETAAAAEHLRADLQRITRSANNELKTIKLAGLPEAVRQAQEARVIDEARARAVRRVESTMRQLDAVVAAARAQRRRPPDGESFVRAGMEETQVIPAVTDGAPAVTDAEQAVAEDAPTAIPDAEPAVADAEPAAVTDAEPMVTDAEPVVTEADAAVTDVVPAATDAEPVVDSPTDVVPVPEEVVDSEPRHPPVTEAEAGPTAADEEEPDALEGRHRATDEEIAEVSTPPTREASEPPAARESHHDRLQRLLAFVVHQEPRLNWAIADRSDGTTVLVTDLAHGWIPSDITLPAGVRLLEPGRRSGKVAALVGDNLRIVTYAPGDSLGWLDDFAGASASIQARELPPVDDLGCELSQATHWRDGLPRMVHTLARAAAAGTGVAEEEIDLLRVHRDTARYQLLIQYPHVDNALLLNCLLLAATEGAVTGDSISANYHLAWFHKLKAPTGGP